MDTVHRQVWIATDDRCGHSRIDGLLATNLVRYPVLGCFLSDRNGRHNVMEPVDSYHVVNFMAVVHNLAFVDNYNIDIVLANGNCPDSYYVSVDANSIGIVMANENHLGNRYALVGSCDLGIFLATFCALYARMLESVFGEIHSRIMILEQTDFIFL